MRGLVVRWHGGRIETLAPDRVRAEAGVTLNGLVRYTIGHGLAGLAEWAGTPGTVGGAVHGNAHFQGRLLSESVVSVEVAAPDGTRPRRSTRARWSSATTAAGCSAPARSRCGPRSAWAPATADALRAVARASLAFRKRTQPLALPSAGCVFQNPDPARSRSRKGCPSRRARSWTSSA